VYPKQGEVWWVQLDPTVGSEIKKTRPCAVLSNDVFNRRRNTVVVVPITSNAPESLPLTVAVQGSRVQGVAAIEHLRGVAKERFTSRYDVLSEDAMERIGKAVIDLLDLV